jgi:hypothetical protein
VQCIVVLYRARRLNGNPVQMNAGADHFNGGTTLWDLFISRYKEVGTSWTWVGGASCTASLLRANPPF